MPRFFLEPTEWDGGACLGGDEARHCSRVLRAKPGDLIEVFDGEGRRARARILDVARDRVSLELGEIETEAPPATEIFLAQAVIKGKAMDWLLQKAVELGVSEIQPLATRHAVVRPGEGKEEKWQRVVLEACKQCGRSRMPKVLPILGIREFLEECGPTPLVVASLEPGAVALRERFVQLGEPRRVGFLIGPEGDFSPEEYRMISDHGCLPAQLGPFVLRSETAAIHCLSAAAYAFT